jgi:hypothetical protein
MSPRLSGAILALAAAILLAVSIAGSSWWDGHPYSATRTYTQIAHVGLHGAQLCMDDGKLETCKDAPTHSLFGPVAWLELLACVLLIASAIGLALVLYRDRGDRRTFALAAIGGAALADLLAFVLMIIAPTAEATIPHGAGLYVFFVGSTGALVAGVLARRPEAARTIQQPTAIPPSQPQPAIDFAAMPREHAPRPSVPDLSGRTGAPPNAGGMLAGPSGTLGAPAESPLFRSAPPLRPPTPIPVRPTTVPPPFSRPMPATKPPPVPSKPLFGDGVKPLSEPPPIAQRPLVPPIVPPPSRTAVVRDTDPQGHEAVGDSTDVNVPLSQESIDEQLETVAVIKEDPEELVGKPSATQLEVPKVPVSTASPELPPPDEAVAATSGPTPACPQCEAPMAWVEEHLRFYCKSCRMYF